MAITINHQTNDISATSGSLTIDGSAAGGGAWNLVSTTTVTSAVTSVDFTSIGSYDRYVLKWDCTMDGAQLPLVQIYDNGTLVTSSDYSFIRSRLSSSSSFQTTYSGVISTTGLVKQIGTFEISATESRLPYYLEVGGFTSTGDTGETMFTSGGMKSTYSLTALSGLRFKTTSTADVILTGRFSLYGLSQ